MQEAIALLQGEDREDYREGVRIGREIFASLPENNPLVKREKERWAIENTKDACFANIYLHPIEVDYNVETLFTLIEASGLEFIGFSNPRYWNLERLLGKSPELVERAEKLPERDRYRLIELLDPEISHYEFFLAKPPLVKVNWLEDEQLLVATVELHPCLEGWPSQTLFNYDYEFVHLTALEYKFLQECAKNQKTVKEILEQIPEISLAEVRSLQGKQLILLR